MQTRAVRVSVDTNRVYPLDRRQPDKSSVIARWLGEVADQHEIIANTQVLIELRAVWTGKLKPAFSAADARTALGAVATLGIVDASANLVLDAHERATGQQRAWFDALIVEAAIRSHSDMLASEDFSHGQRLGDLVVQNPFKR